MYDTFTAENGERFNYAYDVIDTIAYKTLHKEALVWCDDTEEKIFSFGELAQNINKAANFL